jgi:apolipoprotein N-acyltransferase
VANRKPAPAPEPPPPTRIERSLGYAMVSVLVLSVLAFIALLIARSNAQGPLWEAIALLPLIGLPFAIILLLILLILGIRRRSNANPKDAGK